MVLALVATSSGCDSGRAAALSRSDDVGGSISSVTVAEMADLRFEVDFTLTSNGRRELGVDVEFSEDRGATFHAATFEIDGGVTLTPESRGDDARFAATPLGLDHDVVWIASADIDDAPQHDLVLRVTPFDPVTRERGSGALSSVFGIGENSDPAIASLDTPSGDVGGEVRFQLTLVDAESDHVGVEAEYSLDGGVTFAAATLVDEQRTRRLATSPAGVAHAVIWAAQRDVPDLVTRDAVFRLRPLDTVGGTHRETGVFTLRTYAPRIDLLTVNRIPEPMNGSAQFLSRRGVHSPFTLLVPEWGFTLWLEFSPHASGAAIDSSRVELTIDGADPAVLSMVDADLGVATLEVTPELALARGRHTVTARVTDVLGNVSAPLSYTFDTTRATPGMRPFDATDTWHVDFTRDNFTIESQTSDAGTVTVLSAMTSNGVADFVEDLRMLGLNSGEPPEPAEVAGLNEIVAELVELTVLGYVNTLFGRSFDGEASADSVNIEFVTEPPEGRASRIAVGGDDPIPGFTIGRAEFDFRNSSRNDDGAADLGVFSTNLIEFYINSSFTFQRVFDPLIPGRGVPLGFHDADVAVLSADFDRFDASNTADENARHDELMAAVDALGRSLATIVAHEIGHSVGLVANGAPSGGLFGGEYRAAFAGPYTTNFHLDTEGNNVMAAAISFSGAIQNGLDTPFFNELNLAYMREQILLD